MTDDNWQSTKLAIGLVGGRYAVNAEVIAGTLIAGEQLTIMSSDKTSFVVDGNGVKLSNASLEVSTDTNRIILNPDVGIQLSQKNPSTGEYDTNALVFSEAGVLEFSGTLKAANGTFTGTVTANDGNIGGWNIETNGLYSSTESIYLDPDGSISADYFNMNSGYVGSWTISGDSIYCGEIELTSIGTKKVYNKTTRKYEIIPGTARMKLGKFLIDKAASENYYIGGGSGSGPTSIENAEWGMSANNSGLCFYTGYGGGPYENNDPGNPDLNNYAFAVNNDGRVTCQGILLGGKEISSWDDISVGGDGWNSPDYGGRDGKFVYLSPTTNTEYEVLVKDGRIMGFVER